MADVQQESWQNQNQIQVWLVKDAERKILHLHDVFQWVAAVGDSDGGQFCAYGRTAFDALRKLSGKLELIGWKFDIQFHPEVRS